MVTGVAGGVPRALTIAGSDSGGGAGVQADLKTFFALGVHGLTAITAVTVQDTVGVHKVHCVPPELVAAQIEAVVGDVGPGAVKTGMLWSAGVVEAVAGTVARLALPNLVVDPVLAAGGGVPLLDAAGIAALRERLLPMAHVVTPNVPEAEALSGLSIHDEEDMRAAARRIRALGPRWVIMKGGHLPAAVAAGEATDLVFDGVEFDALREVRLPLEPPDAGEADQRGAGLHGAGCTFSAALTAWLARGVGVREAARHAKEYVTAAIRHRLALGRGRSVANQWGNRWFSYGRTFV